MSVEDLGDLRRLREAEREALEQDYEGYLAERRRLDQEARQAR